MGMPNSRGMDDFINEYCGLADSLYKFVILYSDYMNKRRDYGNGKLYTMLEIHLLTYIEENPGVTVTELAKIWNKSKSAISQITSKLVQNGMVTRVKRENNSKTVLLYVTEEGERVSITHKIRDLSDITETILKLLRSCSEGEIKTFYKVLEAYTEILTNNRVI